MYKYLIYKYIRMYICVGYFTNKWRVLRLLTSYSHSSIRDRFRLFFFHLFIEYLSTLFFF